MVVKKKWSANAKFEIVLLVLKGETTINEICKRYEVAPGQVHLWKKQFLEKGAQLFSTNDKGTKALESDFERKESKLYEKIGQLIVERDFLKKSWNKFHENNDKD